MQQNFLAGVNKLFTAGVNRWKGFSVGQKIKLSIIVGLLLITLGVTIFLMTRATWVDISNSSMDSTVVANLADALNAEGIPTKYKKNATGQLVGLKVRESDYDNATALIAKSDLVKSGFDFMDAINLMGIGKTATDKQMIERQLRESNLESKIEQIEGVEKATVDINVLDEINYLFPNQQKPVAGVQLVTSSNPPAKLGNTVANIVAYTIVGMDPKDVMVTDQYANVLSGGDGSDLDNVLTQRLTYQNQVKRELEGQIKGLVGGRFDNVYVGLSPVFEWDSKSVDSSILTPPVNGETKGVPTQETKKETSVTDSTNGAEGGLVPNDVTNPNYALNNGVLSSGETSESQTQWDYSRKREIIENAVGEINRGESTASVRLGIDQKYFEDEVEKKGLLANKTWEEFKFEVKNTSTTIEVPEDLVAAIKNSLGFKEVTVIGEATPIFYDKVVTPVPFGTYATIGTLIALIALLALGLIRRTEPVEITEVEPELSVEQLLVSSKPETTRQEVAEIDYVEDSELKKQIDRFVEEKPEAVAQLLRNWISDEWE